MERRGMRNFLNIQNTS